MAQVCSCINCFPTIFLEPIHWFKVKSSSHPLWFLVIMGSSLGGIAVTMAWGLSLSSCMLLLQLFLIIRILNEFITDQTENNEIRWCGSQWGSLPTMKEMVWSWLKDPTGDRHHHHHPLHLHQRPYPHNNHHHHHYHLHPNTNNLFPGCTRSLLKTEPGTIMLQASQDSYRFIRKMIKALVSSFNCIKIGFEPVQKAWRGGKDN